MNLEKAQKIKRICNKIDEIENKLNEITNCSYMELYIVKNPLDDPTPVKIYKKSKVFNAIIEGYIADRESLITDLEYIN